MRLVSAIAREGAIWGVLDGDALIDCSTATLPTLARALDAEADIAALAASGRRIPAATLLRWLPPVPEGRVFCVGLNYARHILEMGRPIPTHPTLFIRDPNSFVGEGEPILKPRESEAFDYEGELAVVLGRPGRRIAERDAMEHVLGWSCLNDGSVRDWQNHTTQFTAGKNFWRSGSWGPWIVTHDTAPPITEMSLVTRVNGEERQRADLSDLVFGIPALVSYLSTVLPLRAGDVIATGTPGGVGAGFRPERWLGNGDLVEVSIDGIGTLANRVGTDQTENL